MRCNLLVVRLRGGLKVPYHTAHAITPKAHWVNIVGVLVSINLEDAQEAAWFDDCVVDVDLSIRRIFWNVDCFSYLCSPPAVRISVSYQAL